MLTIQFLEILPIICLFYKYSQYQVTVGVIIKEKRWMNMGIIGKYQLQSFVIYNIFSTFANHN